MKKLYFICATLFLLLVLTGCKFGAETAEKVATDKTDADSILDDSIFDAAVLNHDTEMCDEILDKNKKQECVDVINSDVQTQEAISKKDKKLCKNIVLERYKESCENRVDQAVKNEDAEKEAKEEDAKLQAEILSIESEAVKKSDADICDDIQDDNSKYACKYNVLANLAIQKNDVSLCADIGQDSYVDKCKSFFSKGESRPPQN